MEKQLKCALLLSLQEMALRTVVSSFWSSPDILSSIWEVPLWGFNDSVKITWQDRFEDTIEDKIMELLLPESLKEQLKALIRPTSLEVLEWKRTHKTFLQSGFKIDVLDTAKLLWTTAGTINYRKTAEELMRCKKISVEARYELACYYCLEDNISLYWKELNEKAREKYNKGKDSPPLLPYCWPHILQGRHSELDYVRRKCQNYNRKLTSFNQCAFEYYAKESCKTAAEYFLQKLTLEEREISLKRSFRAALNNNDRYKLPSEKLSDFLLFLLSAMTPYQQLEAIKARPVAIFFYFLQWPLQDLFSENEDLFWSLLPPSEYMYKALINETMIRGYHYSHFYFPKMFKEFIKQSPQDFKMFFIEEKFDSCTNSYTRYTGAGHFLREFLENEDSESIKVFFRNLDSADRVKIVCRREILKLFYFHMLYEYNGCDCVELCLREASLSKEDKAKIHESITRRLEGNPNRMNVEWKFQRIFDFLKESDTSSGELKRGEKRKLENSSPEQ